MLTTTKSYCLKMLAEAELINIGSEKTKATECR
jgi:hypothetical protein